MPGENDLAIDFNLTQQFSPLLDRIVMQSCYPVRYSYCGEILPNNLLMEGRWQA